MIARIARLIALAGALIGLTACFELDQVLEIENTGAIHYTWALTLDSKIAKVTRAPNDGEWLAETHATLGDLGTAEVNHADGKSVYTLDVRAPDLVAYQSFRERWLEANAQRYPTAKYLHPPTITAVGGRWEVRIDAEPVAADDAERKPMPEGFETGWTFTLRAPEDAVVQNATQLDADGTLTWRTDLPALRHDGVHVLAVLNAPSPLMSRTWAYWIAGGGVLLLAAATGLLRLRRSL